jgi:hypothetical protein
MHGRLAAGFALYSIADARAIEGSRRALFGAKVTQRQQRPYYERHQAQRDDQG